MTRPGRSGAPLQVEEVFAQAMERALGRIGERPFVVVGVSGGLDSVCLARLLDGWLPRYGTSLHIAHFDHALRPESAADAALVAVLARRLGVPFHTRREPVIDRGGLGQEGAARRQRYRFLSEVAREVTPAGETPVVAVAHHADDQAETVLLNLARGGHRGLTGMHELSPLPSDRGEGDILLLRPLLSLRRAQLRKYAAAYGLEWREDATNAVADRPRTLIRHVVLPALAQVNPHVVENLAAAMAVAQDEERLLQSRADLALSLATIARQTDARVVLDQGVLERMDAESRGALLRTLLLGDFPQAAERGLAWARRWQPPAHAGGPWPIAADVVWTALGAGRDAPARISIHREDVLPVEPDDPWLSVEWRETFRYVAVDAPGVTPANVEWQIEVELHAPRKDFRPPGAWEARLDAGKAGPLALTTPQPGMRIAPLGLNGHTRTLGDIFTDRKVPAALRAGWPVVVRSENWRVLWLCGLALSHDARIDAATSSVLSLRWARRLDA